MAKPGEIVHVVLTYEDYCQLPNDGRRYEILEGELAVSLTPTPAHQEVLGNLAVTLDRHVRSCGLGEVYPGPIAVILGQTSVVEPDLVFIRTDRLPIVSARGIEGAPDLVVEVLSPTTEAQDRGAKLQLYARYGVPHCWLVDPEARRLEAYELIGTAYRLAAEVTGGDEFAPALFSGLTLPLDALWPR